MQSFNSRASTQDTPPVADCRSFHFLDVLEVSLHSQVDTPLKFSLGVYRLFVSEREYGRTNVFKYDGNYLYDCITVDNGLCVFEIARQFRVLRVLQIPSST